MRKPRCTHYHGQCDRLVCDRETLTEADFEAEWREWDESVHGQEKAEYFAEAARAVDSRTAA